MLVAHLTDLHVRPPGRAAYRVAETNMLSARAIDAVRRLDPAPDCVIVSGDLTDCGLPEEYDHLAALLAPLRMPVYVVPGNHDRRETLRERLGARVGTLPADGMVRYAVEDFAVRLVALDTLVPGASHGALGPDCLAWLEATLAARPTAPTIVFMHHPPFPCGIAHMDRIALREGAAELEAVIARHPQVERVLCGHHHRPIQVRFGGTIATCSPSVAHQVTLDLRPEDPGSMVLEPPAFQLHAWMGGRLVTHTAYVERFEGPYPFVLDADYPGR